MTYGFLRVACVSPDLEVADCAFNAERIVEKVLFADKKNVRLLVFAELSITGYTCGDLFLQKSLRDSAKDALKYIAKQTEQTEVLFAVGLPYEMNSAIYNCAAFVHKGRILAFIAKSFLPNYSEFYERRWFQPINSKLQRLINFDEEYTDIPFGTKILIEDKNDPDIKIACEICEDMWVPVSPSSIHSLNNATIIVNLSASNEIIGKADYRRNLIKAMSGKCSNAYIYANASFCESTTDLVFSGHNMIACNGSIVAESELFLDCGSLVVADIDVQALRSERLKTNTFSDCLYRTESDPDSDYGHVEVELKDNTFAEEAQQSSIGFETKKEESKDFQKQDIYAFIDKHPFVPADSEERRERCKTVIQLQGMGLIRRLKHIKAKCAVIGLSGGLDSTLALLVTASAFEYLGLDKTGIIAVTMPCFGTTGRTYQNACTLAKCMGVTLKEIDIKEAVNIHFRDIGQDPENHDVTYENSQARERTQVLMDIANKNNGIVIGTGDLSELALGWCTYNGDQMSMYGVNASVPKTLVRYLVSWYADESEKEGDIQLAKALKDILDTPVSPELLPPEDGKISQKTEDLVGPYELHDFFLYNMLRRNFSPKKIFFLSLYAFEEESYTKDFILKWLKTFYRRFFAQQFKRSCMPDGAKVGTVSLSPRGDWRMPSDASAAIWLDELESL